MVVSRSWVAVIVLGLGVLTGSAADSRVEPERGNPTPVTASKVPGMWIWTHADVNELDRERARGNPLTPGVLIATLMRDADGGLVRRRGLSPARVDSDRLSVVVRVDDSVHRLWDAGDPFAAIDRELSAALREARATGARIDEIQLDYDAPSRRLRDWAGVVQRLAKSSLRGVPLWITSIPVHLEDPDYGRSFAGAVVGHELQLFDTGLACNATELRRIESRLRKHALAFRLGVARLERASNGQTTTAHACWSHEAERLTHLPGYAGTWLFPAGEQR